MSRRLLADRIDRFNALVPLAVTADDIAAHLRDVERHRSERERLAYAAAVERDRERAAYLFARPTADAP